MSSLSELSSSSVSQADEEFIRQLIINAEQHILLHHVNKLLTLPTFQNIIQIPTPEPIGQIKKGFAEACYLTGCFPFNVVSRIIGPRGCTVKAIQILCGCSIQLDFIKYNLLQIQIHARPDYESIVKFKIWKAFELIHCLLRTDPSGEDMVKIIQFDDLKFYENQVEIIKNCFTTQQPYHSDINDASAVSSNDYSVVKRFSLEMLKVLEKRMLTYHMNNLLELPMLRDIFSIPLPAASGRVINGYAKKIYSALDFPFNIGGRIIGPRGLTAKVIQAVCGCRIRLRCKEVNPLQVEVFVERDFESIVEFKLWRAFECIDCLLKTFSSDEDMVNEIQLKDLKLYTAQVEMFNAYFSFNCANFSDADSLNALLNEKDLLTTVAIVDMFEKLEKNIGFYHIKNLLTLTRLHNMLRIPPPERDGEIRTEFAVKSYSTLNYPFDVAGRIIGPHNLTAIAIQNICECRIQLRYEQNNTLKVMVSAENDCENVLKFKLWKAFQCIDCLLEIYPFDEDFVGAVQQTDLHFWERQMEIIFNNLPIISSLPVSQQDASFAVSSENFKKTN
ncbi:Protein quaking [Trichinella pseudospiralis]|uniref:Protein quaking n=1 Tax=Trichinella pseudospiralis TaxID=6337 RepID=A0A0V1F0Y6_TRIPS|nr:Protein quaking [Trichinella pseudospiralis]KRZ42715.1 Protein quaking [Trichinella pseudospiralis]